MIYFVADEDLAGIVPSLYAPLTALHIVVYKFSGRYRAFEFAQLTLNLMLPLLLLLGGFVSSSAVLTWALVTPMGAIVYSSRRMSIFWFVAFLGAVIFGALIDSSLDHANSVPAWARMTLFAGNILGPSSLAFFLLAYFVKQNDIAYGLVSFERERSESLLQNMLPSSIAARLKDWTEQVANRFDEVSVLFADMVGLLNEIFTEFDNVAPRGGEDQHFWR